MGVWTAEHSALVLIDYQKAHRIAIERLAHVGAVPTTALAVVTELFRDWATPLAGPARDVLYWYFNEVPKHTDQVGVAEVEKPAAAAAGGQLICRAGKQGLRRKGAGGSMGRATALACAREAALVVGSDVTVEPAETTPRPSRSP